MRPAVQTFANDRSKAFSWGDVVVVLALVMGMALALHLARAAPKVIHGPVVSHSPLDLPVYAAFSLGRMFVAYLCSLIFMFLYGTSAAVYRHARWILLPILDVLQSVPLLSFLPVVLLSLSAILPQRLAIELSAILLIFTSQAWNLTYSWYQSLTTIPHELDEASTVFQFNRWFRLKNLEFPFATIGLIWNSMMSWAGGWFFLMASEIFVVGSLDFRLPGLGSYLKQAALAGDFEHLFWGIGVLVAIVVVLDQLVWRPLIAWAWRNKVETTPGEIAPRSWFYDALVTSKMVDWLWSHVMTPWMDRVDLWSTLRLGPRDGRAHRGAQKAGWFYWLILAVFFVGLIWGVQFSLRLMMEMTWRNWLQIGVGAMTTFARVFVSLLISLAWTIPVGVAIGTNPRLSRWLQPLVQIAASVPATAFLPLILVILLNLPYGLNLTAIGLMLLGAQWYLLFNIIAGAQAIPHDLHRTADALRLSRGERWRSLIFPAIFPYLITGCVAASGAAWNATIVAEYVEFGGRIYKTVGLGSLIAQATEKGNYALLMASTLSMILCVTMINRFVWRQLYQLAEERYRLD